MKVQILARPYQRTIGLARYTQALIGELEGMNGQICLVPPRQPWPLKLAHRMLAPFGFDMDAFFLTYPISAPFSRDAVTHLPAQHMAVIMWLHPWLHPTIVTVHDIIPFLVRNDPRQSTFQHPLDIAFDRLAMGGLKRADAIISVSEHTKKTLIQTLDYPPESIYVIYEGVSRRLFHQLQIPAEFYRRYELEPALRYILFVGSDNPRKNFPRLLDAFAQVYDRHPTTRLVKVGSGEYAAQAGQHRQKIEEMGLKEVVQHYENVPDRDLVYFYNLAEVFVFPSLYEGFGLPPLEAMACSTPVVCSNAASLPEVVGDAALTIDPYDTEGLAEAIQNVLADPALRQQLREKGLQRAAHFTWERTARETFAVYEKVLGSRVAKGPM